MWEPVDWQPFDIAGDRRLPGRDQCAAVPAELSKQAGTGKPLVVTEFGCCGYAGAA